MQACCGNDLGWATYLPLWLLDFREDDTEGLDHFQKFDLQRGETQKKQELGYRKHLSTIPGCETFAAWKQLEEECRPSRACPLCAGPQDGAGHGLGRTPRDSLAMTTASRLRDRLPGPNLLRPGWSEGARPRQRETRQCKTPLPATRCGAGTTTPGVPRGNPRFCGCALPISRESARFGVPPETEAPRREEVRPSGSVAKRAVLREGKRLE